MSFLNSPLEAYPSITNLLSYIQTDIQSYSDNNNYYYKLDVPGMSKEDLKVSVTNNRLTIYGVRKDNKHIINRSINVMNVDLNNISASLVNGVLTITIVKNFTNTTQEHIINIE